MLIRYVKFQATMRRVISRFKYQSQNIRLMLNLVAFSSYKLLYNLHPCIKWQVSRILYTDTLEFDWNSLS